MSLSEEVRLLLLEPDILLIHATNHVAHGATSEPDEVLLAKPITEAGKKALRIFSFWDVKGYGKAAPFNYGTYSLEYWRKAYQTPSHRVNPC